MSKYTKKFDVESLRFTLMNLSPGETFIDPEGNTFTLIKLESNLTIDQWASYHRMIFKFNGVLYASDYSISLTDYQNETPYEHDRPVGYRVELKEVTVLEYVDVE